MFRALERESEEEETRAGRGGAAAGGARVAELIALTPLADDEGGRAAPPAAHPRERGLHARLAGAVDRFERWCARVELAPDLACDIGSRKWFRGLATMLALGAAAIALWPDFSAVEAAVPLDGRQREEFRSQSIAPLAFGADSGRHMGATPRVRPLASVPERPFVQLVSTLGQGDSFGRMLERAGVAQGDVDRIASLVSGAVPVDTIADGTRFDITLGRRPAPGAARPLDALGFRARFDLDLAIERDPAGHLALVRHPIAVDATPLRVRGRIGSSLYRSARNAGVPVSAIQSYLQAIDKYVSLDSDIAADDEFDIILAYKRSARGERQAGELLYAGLTHGGKRLQLLRWGKDGEMYAASAIGQPRAVPVGQPVAGHMTSPYGMRRHPILGYKRMHAGIDFGARYGSPIYAVADGVVTFAGRHGGHGNYVRLQHAGGLGTGYGHMSRIAVRNGSHVKAGQVIGYVGSTGLSTGPHLHFEAYRNGHTINPSGIRIVARPEIDGKERDAFKARLQQLLTVEPGAALATMAAPVVPDAGVHREIDRLEPKAVD